MIHTVITYVDPMSKGTPFVQKQEIEFEFPDEIKTGYEALIHFVEVHKWTNFSEIGSFSVAVLFWKPTQTLHVIGDW